MKAFYHQSEFSLFVTQNLKINAALRKLTDWCPLSIMKMISIRDLEVCGYCYGKWVKGIFLVLVISAAVRIHIYTSRFLE